MLQWIRNYLQRALEPSPDLPEQSAETLPNAQILVLSFRGKHRGQGSDMIAYVQTTVRAHSPAAVLIDMLEFRYVFGDDLGALLFPLSDKEVNRLRPFCIVAKGQAAPSPQSLFRMTMVDEVSKAHYVASRSQGLAYLNKQFGYPAQRGGAGGACA